MKVGLLDMPAARLNAYWAAYLKELGVQVMHGQPNLSTAQVLELGRESLPGEPLGVQLALGRILALGRVDAVLVPQLPAVGGDAWGEALTELLPRRISGLPTLLAVPDDGPELEGAAAEVGLKLSQNAGQVRRALEKVRLLAGGPKENMPLLSRAGRATVAVVGPRSLLAEPELAEGLRAALEALGLHPVFSHELPLNDVLKRAERMEQAAQVPTGERELFGALSLLGGKSAVRGFVLAVPARDGAVRATLGRLARKLHKPYLMVEVEGGQTDFPALEAFRDAVTLGTPQQADEEEHA